MIPAFWDASALVPLCVDQKPSLKVAQLVQQYSIVVWWSTPVELRSAFERLAERTVYIATRAAHQAKLASRNSRPALP